jgi:hypothetical protein
VDAGSLNENPLITGINLWWGIAGLGVQRAGST